MRKKNLVQPVAFRFRRFVRKPYSVFNSMRRLVNIGFIVGTTLTMANAVSAQEVDSREQKYDLLIGYELEEVMVTASRVETPYAQTPKTVTVITKDRIEKAPVKSVQDLLVYVSGIDVRQRGGHGVQADISIRGGNADQVAILLNGVNISNPQTGHYSFDVPVNISDIERIEILQGPSGLVYGSGAFSGGINIITKKNANRSFSAKIEGGMYNQKGVETRAAIGNSKVSHSLSAGHYSSDGYVENSDYNISNLLWQTRINIQNRSKIDFQLGYNDKDYGANTFYSASYPNQYERTASYIGSVKGEFGRNLKFIPILYWNRHHDQFDLTKDSESGRNFHRTDVYGTNLIVQYESKYGTTSIGNEIRREDIISSKLGEVMAEPHGKYKNYADRTIVSSTVEHAVSIADKVNLSVGAMMNYNTFQSGVYRFYPSVSASYRPMDDLKISSSWSKSSRMPTYTELYYNTPTHIANLDLEPEKSEAADLGLRYIRPTWEVDVNGFLLWGKNMIDWVKFNETDEKYTSSNLSRVNSQGVEIGGKLHLGSYVPFMGERALFGISYTRLHQKYKMDQNIASSTYALNYLRDKVVVQLDHQIYKDLSASWYMRFQKRMGVYEKYENMEKQGNVPYPSFSTLDLKLNYVYDNIAFSLNLNNIYDTQYFDLGNIPQSGFWLMGGISYTLR